MCSQARRAPVPQLRAYVQSTQSPLAAQQYRRRQRLVLGLMARLSLSSLPCFVPAFHPSLHLLPSPLARYRSPGTRSRSCTCCISIAHPRRNAGQHIHSQRDLREGLPPTSVITPHHSAPTQIQYTAMLALVLPIEPHPPRPPNTFQFY